MSAVMRVVVLRPGGLGDALLAFPALAALRQRWPTAHITFAARPDVAPLATATGLADSTRAYDDPIFSALWHDDPPRVAGALGEILASADAVVAWLRDEDGRVTRNLRALDVRQVVVAPGRPDRPDAAATAAAAEHVALYLLRTLAPLLDPDGVAHTPSLAQLAARMPLVMPPPENETHVTQVWTDLVSPFAPRRVVALHPGSGGSAKCWPAEHFAELATLVWRAGALSLVLAGPADEAVLARLLAPMAENASFQPCVARDLPLPVLAGVLARCDAFVGNDAGVSHLAGLVGCPTLALFGPTDPAIWAPVGRRVRVLRAPAASGAPTMDTLPIAPVWAELTRLLADGAPPPQ